MLNSDVLIQGASIHIGERLCVGGDVRLNMGRGDIPGRASR